MLERSWCLLRRLMSQGPGGIVALTVPSLLTTQVSCDRAKLAADVARRSNLATAVHAMELRVRAPGAARWVARGHALKADYSFNGLKYHVDNNRSVIRFSRSDQVQQGVHFLHS